MQGLKGFAAYSLDEVLQQSASYIRSVVQNPSIPTAKTIDQTL